MLLAVLAAVVFFETRAMPVAAAVRPRRADERRPTLISAFLAVLAVGHVVAAFRHGLPEREADRLGPMLWIVGGLVLQMLLLQPGGLLDRHRAALRLHRAGLRARAAVVHRAARHRARRWSIWLVFAGLLKLSLPAGPLEHLFL